MKRARRPLRLTVLELPAQFGAADQVLAEADRLLAQGPTDLVLLPECALTGYVSPAGEFDLRPLAEPRGGPSERGLAELARRHRVHLVGPLVERDAVGEKVAYYNTMVAFDRDGAVTARYRKRHPWYPERWATPGDERAPVFDVLGWLTTIAICFDVHTLAEDAAAELERADLLLFPSAWVEDEGDDLRRELLPPLARRFGVTIANANWAPGDVILPGQGASRVIARDGRELARATRARLDVVLHPEEST